MILFYSFQKKFSLNEINAIHTEMQLQNFNIKTKIDLC